MRRALEFIWDNCFSEVCANIDSQEEQELLKRIIELREKAGALLDQEQASALDAYVTAIYQLQAAFMKKAFFNGCKFATSFIIDTDFLK